MRALLQRQQGVIASREAIQAVMLILIIGVEFVVDAMQLISPQILAIRWVKTKK